MSSFLHVNNKEKYILILGQGPTQGLDGTKLTAATRYSINVIKNNKKFCLICAKMEQTVIRLLMVQKLSNSKEKILQIVATPLYLGNFSAAVTIDNMKKTVLNRYIYGFSVDYDATTVDDILKIQKHLMKKNNVM